MTTFTSMWRRYANIDGTRAFIIAGIARMREDAHHVPNKPPSSMALVDDIYSCSSGVIIYDEIGAVIIFSSLYKMMARVTFMP